MQLPANFDPAPLGIETVEQLLSWCFETIKEGYGPGEYRPNNTSAIAFENVFNSGFDGNKRERVVLTSALKLKADIEGVSLRPWQKVDEFTTNEIPTALLTAV